MAMASAMTSFVVTPASLLPSQRPVAPSRGAKAPISVVPRGQPTAGTSRSDFGSGSCSADERGGHRRQYCDDNAGEVACRSVVVSGIGGDLADGTSECI